jgi:hypothetical protein
MKRLDDGTRCWQRGRDLEPELGTARARRESNLRARRSRQRPLRQLAHERRNVRPRSHFGHDLLDLALRLVDGASKQLVSILTRQNRGQLGDAAEVKATVRQHLEQHGMLPSGLGHVDPKLGLALGQVQDGRAVREHRRHGEARVEVSRVDLADVGDKRGLEPARPVEEIVESGEDLVVGECSSSRSSAMHRL